MTIASLDFNNIKNKKLRNSSVLICKNNTHVKTTSGDGFISVAFYHVPNSSISKSNGISPGQDWRSPKQNNQIYETVRIIRAIPWSTAPHGHVKRVRNLHYQTLFSRSITDHLCSCQ